MESTGDNNEERKIPPKEEQQQEQARPTQEQLDAEAKRRAVSGRATAPARAPGVVQASRPAPGKGTRGRSAENSSSTAAASNGPSSAAANLAAVERNVEDRDALAKRRAAARSGPATTAGIVAERTRPSPAPAPTRLEPPQEPRSVSQEARSVSQESRSVSQESRSVSQESRSVSQGDNQPPQAASMPDYSARSENYEAGASNNFDEDVEKQMDESEKENHDGNGPEAAVAQVEVGEMDSAPVVYPGSDPIMHDGVVADGIEAFVADTVVDATGVAVVMSEEEEEQFEQKRRKKYLCYGAVVLVIVAVSIVVPVVLLVGPGKTTVVEMPPSVAPSGAPSSMPSGAPTTDRFSFLLDYLEQLAITQDGAFQDRSSPQYRAALWLSDDDTYLSEQGLEFQDPKTLQRYAVATFYFATGGDGWKLCGRNSASCGDTEWLDPSDECGWFSISCNTDNVIDHINFPATGNDLIGEIPAEMALLTGLQRFLAPENSLKGDLDLAFNGLSTLRTVAIPDNRLEGPIPTGILSSNPEFAFLDLGGNQFGGAIPSGIAEATKLTDLQLDANVLTGTIPSEIGSLDLLVNLELQTNFLEGPIPDELYSLTRLTSLSVRENTDINGTISPSISQLTSLTVLQMGFTGLGGTLPEEMFVLTNLSELNLEGASFTGTIPESFRRLNSSLMDLFLNDNEFTGAVPEAFDYLTALETLQIQGNQLTGSISAEVCNERGLRFQQLATLIVDCVVECDCCDNCEDP